MSRALGEDHPRIVRIGGCWSEAEAFEAAACLRQAGIDVEVRDPRTPIERMPGHAKPLPFMELYVSSGDLPRGRALLRERSAPQPPDAEPGPDLPPPHGLADEPACNPEREQAARRALAFACLGILGVPALLAMWQLVRYHRTPGAVTRQTRWTARAALLLILVFLGIVELIAYGIAHDTEAHDPAPPAFQVVPISGPR
jgi:hypothetical protein